MPSFISHAPEILLLAFLAVTFLQSGADKILGWKGNLTWLSAHFSKTPLKNLVPLLLAVLLVVESASGILCAIGMGEILSGSPGNLAFAGALLACLALLMLLLGQRIAKDYDGARTVVIYFMPAVFLVYLLQQ